MDKNDRAKFEAWVVRRAKASNSAYTTSILLRRLGDDYATAWVDSAWMGWQAAIEELKL